MCNTCNEILKKYPKNNPMYKQGDILVNVNDASDEKIVSGICGKAIFLEDSIYVYTEESLEKFGYKLKQKEWEPKEGNIYWYICSTGKVATGRFGECSSWDTIRKNFLGIFPTRELAEKRLEEIKKLLK